MNDMHDVWAAPATEGARALDARWRRRPGRSLHCCRPGSRTRTRRAWMRFPRSASTPTRSLRELGLDDGEIARLRAENAI